MVDVLVVVFLIASVVTFPDSVKAPFGKTGRFAQKKSEEMRAGDPICERFTNEARFGDAHR